MEITFNQEVRHTSNKSYLSDFKENKYYAVEWSDGQQYVVFRRWKELFVLTCNGAVNYDIEPFPCLILGEVTSMNVDYDQ